MLLRMPREKVRVYFEFWYPNLNALAGGQDQHNMLAFGRRLLVATASGILCVPGPKKLQAG
jgi:hypothetical protein